MTTLAIRPPTGLQAGPRGPAFGFGISLLVHAAVLAWLMHVPAPRPAGQPPLARMQVRLAPARPARPVQPEAAPAAKPVQPARSAPQRAPRARPAAPARASETPAVISVPSSNAPDPFTVPPAATPDTNAAPTVDLAAARQAARAIAREESKNMVSLPARKPVVDPNADHHVDDPIEKARRPGCQTAYAGMGLLALIPLAKDAITGTGCKW